MFATRANFLMAYSEKHPSGAKAHIDFAAFTARLKSCPVTKPLYTKNEIALRLLRFLSLEFGGMRERNPVNLCTSPY
jgi:hypothetical protein